MADVFISYSQRAKEPTEKLVDHLSQLGLECWYDTSLVANDVFWKVIMKKITDAKAVVVIWSPPALESEWVYSEAKLAHEQKKLVCARTDDVTPGAVPLPFNGYNVCHIDEQRDPIIEALRRFGLQPGSNAPVIARPAPLVVSTSAPIRPPTEAELAALTVAFDYVKEADDAATLRDFLKDFAALDHFFVRQAQNRLEGLGGVPENSIPRLTPEAETEIAASESDVILRLAPDMHTAPINRISLTGDGAVMASASDDKTVKLWTLPEGKLIRTLRPPIGEGDEGKVYAVAMDPEGRWVAAGGCMKRGGGGHYVTIFDTDTGAVRARLGPLPNVVNDLEVSPDGARLAVGLYGQNGIRIWETANWQPIWQDKDYGGSVYGLAFASDGRLATACEDGHVRLYGGDGQLLAKALSPGGGDPHSIAFSPDGTRLAVGYYDSLALDVLDATSLQRVYCADTEGLSGGNLSSVAWLGGAGADLRLAAGGMAGGWRSERLFIWDEAGRGGRRPWPGPASTIKDIAPAPDGGPGSGAGAGLALAGAEPSLALYGSEGTRYLNKPPEIADLRDKRYEHFTVSADGLRLRFGLDYGGDKPVLFDLAALTLIGAPEAPSDLTQPNIDSLTIKGWQDTYEPALTRKTDPDAEDITTPLELDLYETARSLAIGPDGGSFILGTEWYLRCFDAAGSELWQRPVPGIAWGVNLVREGRLILAAYGDGTIRWHRVSDGAELLALFIHLPDGPKDTAPQDCEWILWTPEGYYTASSERAEDLIGWHVNRGQDEAADFYPTETFAETFRRKDKVAAALDGV
ncbi:MAG: TIR domain-containing protein [Pseudomonadota bacterium]